MGFVSQDMMEEEEDVEMLLLLLGMFATGGK